MLAAMLAAGAFAQSEPPTKLLRFPDIHGDQLVFSYGGDLWRASVAGGLATRLTAHPGLELFGKFSPDGRSIAFTGQYEGDEQVYVMPATGGEPRQLTFYPARGPLPPRWGYDHQVYGWTPDGEQVLFRSLRDADGISVNSSLYTVDADGGLPVRLPMPDSGAGDLSPDGRRIFYSPLARDFRTWKRYEGGWAQDLYVFDLESLQVTPIAHHKRTERDPMWLEDGIYFVSDRDDTLNLFRSSPDGGDVTQITDSKDWDVRWASSDGRSRIVYEHAGELAVYEAPTGEVSHPSIHVPGDGLGRRPRHLEVGDQVTDWELSPGGERALFIARGDVFTAPIEKGPTRNLTNSSNAAEKHSRWSPDGLTIAFVSDESGEEQLYTIPQEGGVAKRVSAFGEDIGMLFAPAWSPDSERLAVSDKNGKVHVVDVATGTHVEIADDEHGLIGDYAWSPDSRWLAFSMSEDNGNSSLWIWSRDDGALRKVTGEMFNEAGPTWDPGGQYLYYLSQREFTPQISQVEWNFAGNRMTAVFALALTRSTPHPLPPESDEVKAATEAAAEEGDGEEGDGEEGGAKKTKGGNGGGKKQNAGADAEDSANDEPEEVVVKIDFDGLAERVVRLPIEADNIGGLVAVEGRLVYSTFGEPYYGRASATEPALHFFDLESREPKTVLSGLAGWALSADGKKVIVNRTGSFSVHDLEPDSKEGKAISTAGLELDSVPAEEWRTIFDQVWRRYRDFFYVDNLHGYDWDGIGEQYQTLLEHVAHRSDLNYVLGEMIAELNVGHAYIAGGDFEIPERPKVALPGARFALDPASGRYRIAEILDGHNAEPRYRSPLTEVGVDVAEGDFVLAIDGVALEGSENPYRLLGHKTDPVTLTVAASPDGEAREVSFNPIDDESRLVYLDQVNENRAWVDQRSAGRVGYLHVPDMGANGAYEFLKWFYPQTRKEGLIVDVRSNGGGNISQWLIERLDTKLLGTGFSFSDDSASTYPATVFFGHMVCLINETSASDGDIFPARFREAGLGPLIGKRTWGGVVGISGFGPLLDGGNVSVPLGSTNGVDGSYVIEGVGVEPDIEVANLPADVIAGRDAQLERGLQEVLSAMEREPRKLPARPEDPVKTKRR
jgi:tricorn protease